MNQIKFINTLVNENRESMLINEKRIADCMTVIQENKNMVIEMQKRQNYMDSHKVEVEKYDKWVSQITSEMETNRLAIRDNFAQLLATDNYLEKYVPFTIQNFISESLGTFLDKDQKRLYKDHEYKKYKFLHRLVIVDEGIPDLKKRAYSMPGYRRVLDDGERKLLEMRLTEQQESNVFEYALNTYILKKKTEVKAHRIVPEDITESFDNDIVPVDMTEHSK